MTYIDCHCHLAENLFFKQIDLYVREWKECHISKVGAMATNLKTSHRNLILAEKYPEIIIPAIGRHPWGAFKTTSEELEQFEEILRKESKVIIGEIGLDHYFVKQKEQYKKQAEVLHFFFDLARKYKRPIMLHTTGAEREVLEILKTIHLKEKICFHWYSGPEKTLNELINLECYFSVNSAFLHSKNHRRVVEKVDLDHLLTESDGPVKFQGEPSTPKMIPFLCKSIAEIKELDEFTISLRVQENYKGFLGK